MPVLKEYLCPLHGEVENVLPICPECGMTEPNLQRQFRTPIGLKGDMTKFKDQNIKGLIEGCGLKNYSNNVSQSHDRPGQNFQEYFKPKSEFGNLSKTTPLATGGINVNETREVLRKMGKVTKIYDARDLR